MGNSCCGGAEPPPNGHVSGYKVGPPPGGRAFAPSPMAMGGGGGGGGGGDGGGGRGGKEELRLKALAAAEARAAAAATRGTHRTSYVLGGAAVRREGGSRGRGVNPVVLCQVWF